MFLPINFSNIQSEIARTHWEVGDIGLCYGNLFIHGMYNNSQDLRLKALYVHIFIAAFVVPVFDLFFLRLVTISMSFAVRKVRLGSIVYSPDCPGGIMH